MSAALELLRGHGVLGPLDDHFARTLARLAGEDDARVLLAAAIASRQVGAGHVCLDLQSVIDEGISDDEGVRVPIDWPGLDEWLAALRRSSLVAVEENAVDGLRPLVVDAHGRVYLHRYWSHERNLARGIRERVATSAAEPLAASTRKLLRRLFPSPTGAEPESPQGSLFPPRRGPDWQRIAAIAALQRRFCVISGGPGTGKTYTVVKILALLIEQALAGGVPPPRIQLVAPTGKAAARLRDSIQSSKGGLACSEAVRAAIPEEAATIHRCLGSRPGSSTRFRHDRDNPLLADVVLVDEASMVDLALMSRLIEALPPEASLILLGDRDQLASVEAGAVLGDICNTGGERQHSHAFAAQVAEIGGDAIPLAADAPPQAGMWDCVVHLTHSYRYDTASRIGLLAAAINAGDANRALEILAAEGGGVSLVESAGRSLDPKLVQLAAQCFEEVVREKTPAEQLARLERFRVLCALRRGPHGAETANREIEAALMRHGLLDAAIGTAYDKRPVLITRNDYQLELYNGDIGVIGRIATTDPAAPQLAAFFASPGGTPRSVALSRLPQHETVFAMTVHKSQGSEFDHVAVVLPPESSPLLSRELLYTAVSRARQRVTLFADREILRAAIGRRIERASGLRDLLWS